MNDVIILFLCHIFFGGMKTMKCSVWSRTIIWTRFRLISWHSKLEWTFTQASIWTLAIVWTYALIYPSASVWTNFIVWTYYLLYEHILQYEHVCFIVNTTFEGLDKFKHVKLMEYKILKNICFNDNIFPRGNIKWWHYSWRC